MAEVIRINEKTWRIEDGGVRFLLLCGKEKAALVDTGMNAPDARRIAEGLTDLPLILINTHADPDHISGNSAFSEVYMSSAEEENYRNFGGKTASLSAATRSPTVTYSCSAPCEIWTGISSASATCVNLKDSLTRSIRCTVLSRSLLT